MAQLGDQPEYHAAANEPGGRTFGAERKLPVESGLRRRTSGGEWKHPEYDRGPSAWVRRLPKDSVL